MRSEKPIHRKPTDQARNQWEESFTVVALLGLTCVLAPISDTGELALVCLWMGFGHATLFFLGLYPKLTLRASMRGVLAYALGVFWPLWVFCYRRRISV